MPQKIRRGGGASLASDNDGEGGGDTFAQGPFDPYTVEGVAPQGTTINLFDYWITEPGEVEWGGSLNDGSPDLKRGINKDHDLMFCYGNVGSGINKWVGNEKLPRQGLVERLLDGGYPRLVSSDANQVSNPESLSYLFNSQSFAAGKAAHMDVKNLLQVDKDGYYYYNSQSNFAEFDEDTNSFKLYNTWGVKSYNGTADGQFFPFNEAEEVFNVGADGEPQLDGEGMLIPRGFNARDPILNHWFGLSMGTRFMQANNGFTDEGETVPVTYEFSGDDDVWVFIDGVLVGDIGGIHDQSFLKIDFSTGNVQVGTYMKDGVNIGEEGKSIIEDNLKNLFKKAGRESSVEWNGSTFKDGTIHELRFFYLERGNSDSNLFLKFNLVTLPESDIQKVDQGGNPIEGAGFELYAADENYAITGESPLASGTTDANGMLTLETVANGGFRTLLSFDELHSRGIDHYVLREIEPPLGYRAAGDVQLYYEESNTQGTGIVLSKDYWRTGTYAGAKLTASAPDWFNTVEGEDNTVVGTITEDEIQDGMMFAVVFKRNGDMWLPISGDNIHGWNSAEDDSMESVIAKAKENQVRFTRTNSSFNNIWKATIERLPGDIKNYYHFTGGADSSQYAIGYYYSEAKTFNGLTPDNTWRIGETNDNKFGVQYSVRLYVPDVRSALYAQKVDEKGNPVNGAKFSLYAEKDVESVAEDGSVTLKEGAEPCHSEVTADLTMPYELKGGVVFGYVDDDPLLEGKYYLLEDGAPEGYIRNKTATPVIVDETGVYAYAGDEGVDDGITVLRGVGSLVSTLSQFGENDSIDASLHDIKAQFQVSENEGDWNWKPSDAYLEKGSEDVTNIVDDWLHLQYNAGGAIFEYGPYDGNGAPGLTADSGWARLYIEQCYVHQGSEVSNDKQNWKGRDLTNLFSRTCRVIVRDYPADNLQVTKTVEGEGAPEDATFAFDVTLERGDAAEGAELVGEYECEVVDAKGNAVKDSPVTIAFVEKDRAVKADFALKAEQTITIHGLPMGAKWTVEEQPLDNPAWKVSSRQQEGEWKESTYQEGAITQEQFSKVEFKNAYKPKSIAYELTAKKTLMGEGDAEAPALKEGQFAFILRGGENGTPMPEGSTFNGELKVWEKTVRNEAVAANENFAPIKFGSMTYEHAGNYRYVVAEDRISEGKFAIDSRRYEAIVKIVDSNGVLEFAGVEYNVLSSSDPAQKADGILFENRFTPDSTTGFFQVSKRIKNEADPNAKPDFENPASPNNPNGFEVVLKAHHAEKTDTPNVSIEVDIPMPSGDATVKTDGWGVANLPKIAYDLDDLGNTYFYTIEETKGEERPGIHYDQEEVWAKVSVGQNDQGDLRADVAYRKGENGEWEPANGADGNPIFDARRFVNTYKAEGKVALEANKILTGRDMGKGDFSLKLAAVGGNDPNGYEMPANLEAEVPEASDGKEATVVFDAISFSKQGTYGFIISEVIPEDAVDSVKDGVEYDSREWIVTVEVTDNGDGTLDAKPVKYERRGASGEAASGGVEGVVFKNVYRAKGETKLIGTKVLEGRPWQTGDDFSFALTATDDTKQAVRDGKVVMPEEFNVNAAVKPGATDAASFEFGKIEFTAEGTYTFQVKENKLGDGKVPGVTYDETVYDVSVVVADNNHNGTLDCTPTITVNDKKVDGIEFNNKYASKGEVVISGKKELANREWTADDAFAFVIEPSADHQATVDAVKAGDVVMPKDRTAAATKDKQDFSFGAITFKNVAAGDTKTYEFTVREQVPEGVEDNVKDGVTYDTHVATIKVTVTGDTDGKADVSTFTTSEGSLTFKNAYKPKAVDVPLSGTKTLAGREGGVKDGEFSFAIEKVSFNGDASEGALAAMPLSAPSTVKNDAEGGFVFSAMHFTQAGDYVYRVSEVGGGEVKDGVTYDPTEYLVTVEVSDDGKGNLRSAVSYAVEGGGEAEAVKFENKYAADPAKGTIKGMKSLVVEDGTLDFKAGMFAFEVAKKSFDGKSDETALAAMPMPDVVKVDNKDDGDFEFGPIEFTQRGTYVYEVSETSGAIPGVTYDGVPVTVTFKVGDDGEGNLAVENAEYRKGGTAVDCAAFENKYCLGKVASTLSGWKTLVGETDAIEPPALAGGEFTFELNPSEDALADIEAERVQLADGAKSLTAENDANGSFTFGDAAVTFFKTGEYTFTVTEQGGNDSTVKYDKTVYTATARVTDKGAVDGETGKALLSVEWEIVDDGGKAVEGPDALAFENAYKPAPASVVISGSKELVGAREGVNAPALKGGEFMFELKDAQEGNLMGTTTNRVDGTFSFKAIKYTEPGTFIYVVSEAIGAMGGVDYDDVAYTVTVQVDDVDGKLTPTVSYALANREAAAGIAGIAFTNTYDPAPAEAALGAIKTLSGRDLQDGEFTFVLERDGEPVDTVSNVGRSVQFAPITFDLEGIYEFAISEVKGTATGITYDESVHKATVVVTDDGTGTLKATVEYEGGAAPEFENSYTPPKPEEPENPENPDDPDDPKDPEDPDSPEDPEEPGSPEKPEKPKEPELVRTGDTAGFMAAAAMVGAFAACIAAIGALAILRRNNIRR